MNNEFVKLKKYPNYEIDINGNLRNIKTKKIIKPRLNTNGYLRYSIKDENNIMREVSQHRLLKLTFDYKDGCENLFIDHINCNKTDNRLSNLDWVTPKENFHRAIENKLISNTNTIITDEIVINIRKEYIPGSNGNLTNLQHKYKIGRHSVLDIIKNRIFNHLPKTEELSEYYLKMKNYPYYQGPYYHKIEIPLSIQEEIKYKFFFYHRNKTELGKEYQVHRKTIESIIFGKYKERKDRVNNGLKLTEHDVLDIKRELANKVSHSILSKKYNVCLRTISDISTGKSWANIK